MKSTTSKVCILKNKRMLEEMKRSNEYRMSETNRLQKTLNCVTNK